MFIISSFPNSPHCVTRRAGKQLLYAKSHGGQANIRLSPSRFMQLRTLMDFQLFRELIFVYGEIHHDKA